MDPCQVCRGETRVQKEHTILVKVPAGVEQDTRIRYQGEGEAGKFAGPSGDLYVVLNVKAHAFFERDGDDLHCVLPVIVSAGGAGRGAGAADAGGDGADQGGGGYAERER